MISLLKIRGRGQGNNLTVFLKYQFITVADYTALYHKHPTLKIITANKSVNLPRPYKSNFSFSYCLSLKINVNTHCSTNYESQNKVVISMNIFYGVGHQIFRCHNLLIYSRLCYIPVKVHRYWFFHIDSAALRRFIVDFAIRKVNVFCPKFSDF